MGNITRRDMLERTSVFIASMGAVLPAAAATPDLAATARKLKVAVVGGHPDDPESGCGGTIARYTEEGHEAVIIYLTRGESG